MTATGVCDQPSASVKSRPPVSANSERGSEVRRDADEGDAGAFICLRGPSVHDHGAAASTVAERDEVRRERGTYPRQRLYPSDDVLDAPQLGILRLVHPRPPDRTASP